MELSLAKTLFQLVEDRYHQCIKKGVEIEASKLKSFKCFPSPNDYSNQTSPEYQKLYKDVVAKGVCLNPANSKEIQKLFTDYLKMNPQFGECRQLDNHDNSHFFYCYDMTQSSDYLVFDPNPKGFSLKMLNDYKVSVNAAGETNRWQGYKISCEPGGPDSHLHYVCNGYLPGSSKPEYQMEMASNNVCTDQYAPNLPNPEFVKSDCTGLHKKFLSGSTYQTVSRVPWALFYTKIAAGITAGVGFGMLAYSEWNKIYKATQIIPDFKIGIANGLASTADLEKHEESIASSQKRALLYTILSVASFALTAVTSYRSYPQIFETYVPSFDGELDVPTGHYVSF